MRICHVVATAEGWGGLERCVVDLSKIQSTRHQVAVLCSEFLADRLDGAVSAFPMPMHLSRNHPVLLYKIRRALLNFSPDIIHVHANKAATLINRIHWSISYCARVATVHNTKNSTKVFRSYPEVIAVSHKVASKLNRPSTVIWNSILPRTLSPLQIEKYKDLPFIGHGKPILAAVGRMVSAKGFDILLDSFRGVDAYLWLIGEGPLLDSLKETAKAKGLADRVWFAGFRSDVEDLSRVADLMVISSRHEGFPMVFVEYLHNHCPVISTRTAGIEEVLPDEWLCETDNAQALHQLIQKALPLIKDLPVLFSPVFTLAEKELNLLKTQAKVEEIYKRALAHP